MRTGFVSAEEYFWHDTGRGWILPADDKVLQPYEHPEGPETKRRLLNLLRTSGMLAQLHKIEPRRADGEDMALVHDGAYVESVAEMSKGTGGVAGILTPFGRGGFDIALLSTGGCLSAVELRSDL